MNFGTRTDEAESRRIIERALERGATSFDTANMYGQGASETILGKALAGRRDQVRLATKVGLFKLNGQFEGLGKARVLKALDESLQRLKTEAVDLYYLHKPDPSTPIGETLEAIAELLAAGKIRSWGVSNYASWQVLELDLLCDARGIPRPAVSQLLYNLLIRQLDIEYFAFAKRFPIHTAVFNPLCGGMLARAAAPGTAVPKGTRLESNAIYRRRYWNDSLLELAQRYGALAREEKLDLVTLAYAWLSGRPGVDSIIAGPGTVAHLDAALDGCAATVSASARGRIDELYRAHLGSDANYAR
jgi:aryl-alcohol dehydrogenase-like predicted oxidoreductase